jgi:hypothetical protein
MRRPFSTLALVGVLGILALASTAEARGGKRGPFSPEAWPGTILPSKTVHYVSLDGGLEPPSATWTPNLKVLKGGDHDTEPVTVAGHTGVKVKGIKFNTADDAFPFWAKQTSVDVLMQVYGDEAFLNPDGTSRYFDFLTGTLPEPIAVVAGTIPPAAKNGKWNWVLFRVPNGLRHMDGGRLIGTIHPKAKADPGILGVSVLSGQNGGTIRMDGLHDLKIRVVAFGERGAFGEPEQVNRFKK